MAIPSLLQPFDVVHHDSPLPNLDTLPWEAFMSLDLPPLTSFIGYLETPADPPEYEIELESTRGEEEEKSAPDERVKTAASNPSTAEQPRHVYREELKNREFGQEAPQIFVPERGAVFENTARSEGQKCGVKPTPPKPDSSITSGINSKRSVHHQKIGKHRDRGRACRLCKSRQTVAYIHPQDKPTKKHTVSRGPSVCRKCYVDMQQCPENLGGCARRTIRFVQGKLCQPFICKDQSCRRKFTIKQICQNLKQTMIPHRK